MLYSEEFLFLINDLQKNKPCQITQFLLELKTLPDIAYVGIKDNMIIFATQNQMDKFGTDCGLDLDLEESIDLILSYINPITIKPGRFIRKITDKFTDSQIEKFVNNLKGFLKLRQDDSNFSIVEAEEIRKYYLTENHQSEKGQLGKSCMRHENCQKFLDFYCQNPEICKLVILKGINTDKIVGRALLWKTNYGLYLDRVYTILDSDLVAFEEYAKSLGCKWTYHKLYCSNSEEWVDLKIKPKKIDFELYPYFDTFQHYYPVKKVLTSEVIIGDRHYHLMTTTDGSLMPLADINLKLPLKIHSDILMDVNNI